MSQSRCYNTLRRCVRSLEHPEEEVLERSKEVLEHCKEVLEQDLFQHLLREVLERVNSSWKRC